MSNESNIGESPIATLLKTRTGFLGLGPSYGEILVWTVVDVVTQKLQARSVIKGAEKFLAEVNSRNRSL